MVAAPRPGPALPDPFKRGSMDAGWGGFYATTFEPGRPQLRTYGREAEKFFETFKLPEGPERAHKAFAPGPGVSDTWGIGGTYKSGRKSLVPAESKHFQSSSKKHLDCRESDEYGLSNMMARKQHVLNAAGEDMRGIRSKGFLLDDMLQRKGRVPEEMRSEARTIHRMAPPGLKGYMGAEYSNDYFKYGASVPATLMRPSKEDQVRCAAHPHFASQP